MVRVVLLVAQRDKQRCLIARQVADPNCIADLDLVVSWALWPQRGTALAHRGCGRDISAEKILILFAIDHPFRVATRRLMLRGKVGLLHRLNCGWTLRFYLAKAFPDPVPELDRFGPRVVEPVGRPDSMKMPAEPLKNLLTQPVTITRRLRRMVSGTVTFDAQ